MASAALPMEKEPQYPFDRRLGGSHSQFGQRTEEKIIDHTGTQTLAANHSKNKSDIYSMWYVNFSPNWLLQMNLCSCNDFEEESW
jgi:hypothetical protein